MLRNNLWLKLGALLLACFFWLQLTLLRQQQTTIRLPLVINNLPEKVTLTRLPSSVNYSVKGTGLEILKLRLFHVQAYYDAHNITSSTVNPTPDEYKVTLPPSIHLEQLEPLPVSTIIKSEQIRTVLLPVRLMFSDAETTTLFYEKNYTFSPEKISVKAPESQLRNIHYITTSPIRNAMLDKSDFRLRLIAPAPNIVLSPAQVDVAQSSTRFITRLFAMVPIQTGENISVFPAAASVRVRGQNDVLKRLTPADITVRINTQEESDAQYPLQIILPAGVELLDFTPQKVNRIGK